MPTISGDNDHQNMYATYKYEPIVDQKMLSFFSEQAVQAKYSDFCLCWEANLLSIKSILLVQFYSLQDKRSDIWGQGKFNVY